MVVTPCAAFFNLLSIVATVPVLVHVWIVRQSANW